MQRISYRYRRLLAEQAGTKKLEIAGCGRPWPCTRHASIHPWSPPAALCCIVWGSPSAAEGEAGPRSASPWYVGLCRLPLEISFPARFLCTYAAAHHAHDASVNHILSHLHSSMHLFCCCMPSSSMHLIYTPISKSLICGLVSCLFALVCMHAWLLLPCMHAYH
jgi:hypothetical protein